MMILQSAGNESDWERTVRAVTTQDDAMAGGPDYPPERLAPQHDLDCKA